MQIVYLILSIILFLMCCTSFVVQLTLSFYIPAALGVLGGAVSGLCAHLSYLLYRERLLKRYTLETLEKICNFRYIFFIIVVSIIGYHVTYLVIHRDVYDIETSFIALQLTTAVVSVVLLIRVLLIIQKKIMVNLLIDDYSSEKHICNISGSTYS